MTGVHAQILGHVVRRSVDAMSDPKTQDDMQRFFERYQLPNWAVLGIAFYTLLFAVLLASIRYTIGNVIATLMMIETPPTSTSTSHPTDAKSPMEKAPLLLEDPELASQPLPTKPLTRTARTTLRHLVRTAGPLSRWRALVPFLAYDFLASLFAAVPVRPGQQHHAWLLRTPFAILAAVIFAPVHVAWLHAVIAAPAGAENKRWWKRIPGWTQWKRVMLPSAVWAASARVTVLAPGVVACALGVHRVGHKALVEDMDGPARAVFALKLVACALVGLGVAVAVLIPATVTLVRMEASLLPEEDETIVPFDRTFGGKVVPVEEGGSGCVGFVDAWRTVDRKVRLRLVKVYAQLFTMQMVIVILGMVGLATFVAGFRHIQANPN